MKSIVKYSVLFLSLIVAYFVFGVLSCLLPDKAIKQHIAESAPVIAAEGLYPKLFNDMDQYRMDSFTDALMMNQIYNIDRKHPVKAAMLVIRSSEQRRDWDQPGLLVRRVNGETLEEQPYSRYWHGGTFLYRPLFMLMDYATLRFVLFLASSVLLLLLACAYYQKAGWLKTLALSMGFLLTYGVVTEFSMQFFPVLVLTVIGSLLVIKREGVKGFGTLFFVIGSLTCYFDLLTTPLLTLGIPLAVLLSLKSNHLFRIKENSVRVAKLILLWGFGFAFTFVSKWALASLVLGQNIFADVYEVGLYRMGTEEFTRWDAVTKNLGMLNWWIVGVIAVAILVFSIIGQGKPDNRKALLFLALALMPYVWYLLLANHSYLHWWFTFRLQAVTVSCLMLMMADSRQHSL